MTWGHNDKRLFLATGTQIHIAWVSRRIATLQLLCRLRIHNSIAGESKLSALPLPPRIRSLIGNLFAQTIRVCTVLMSHRLISQLPILVLCAGTKCFKAVRIETTCRICKIALHDDSARRGHEYIVGNLLYALSRIFRRVGSLVER